MNKLPHMYMYPQLDIGYTSSYQESREIEGLIAHIYNTKKGTDSFIYIEKVTGWDIKK